MHTLTLLWWTGVAVSSFDFLLLLIQAETWRVRVENTGNGSQFLRVLAISLISGSPKGGRGEPLEEVNAGLSAEIVTEPSREAQLIAVQVTRYSLPVIGANVTAIVHLPAGNSTTVQMQDRGLGEQNAKHICMSQKKVFALYRPLVLGWALCHLIVKTQRPPPTPI